MMKYTLFLLLLAFAARPINGQTAGEAMPIAAPTVAAGTNPQVTPLPESQKGTVGPTTQVLTQEYNETFSPKPTPVPETKAPTTTSSSGNAASQPPSAIKMTTVGLTGIAAAAALL